MIALIDTSFGFTLGLVMVASWMVGGIEPFFAPEQEYARAARFGRFRIGSTVVLLFPPDCVEIQCKEGQKLELGAPVARSLLE